MPTWPRLLKCGDIFAVCRCNSRQKYEEKGSSKPKVDKAENAYNSLLASLNKQLGTAEKLNEVEKLNIELQKKEIRKNLGGAKGRLVCCRIGNRCPKEMAGIWASNRFNY